MALFVKCLTCGKEFMTYPSIRNAGRGKFCCKTCSLSHTNKILEANGLKTRFKKGQSAWNKKGCTYTKSRKGGKKYKLLYLPDNPSSDKKGYIREHRLIMQRHVGRELTRKDVVHHKNGDTLDNRLENLELLSWKQHRIKHLKDNVHKRWQNR